MGRNQAGERDVYGTRVAHPLLCVGETEPHALDHHMGALGRTHGGKVEAGCQVHGDDGGQPLAVGRAFVEADAPVVGRDGLVPGRRVGRHVGGRNPAAVALHVGAEPLGKLALVDMRLSGCRDAAQGLAQGGEAHDLACPRRAPVQEQFVAAGLGRPVVQVPADPIRVAPQLLLLGLPAVCDELAHGVAVLGGPDGRLQDFGQGQPAVAAQEIAPAGHGAGDRDGMAGIARHAVVTECGHGGAGGGAGRPAGTVEGGHLPGGRVVVERKAVAADAGGDGLDHGKHGGGRHGGVRGVAAVDEDFQPGLHG